MDNAARSGEAGFTTAHGFHRSGSEPTSNGSEGGSIGSEGGTLHTAWSIPWKTRNALCGLYPRLPGIEDGEDHMSGLAEEIAQCMFQGGVDGARAQDCSAFRNTEPAWVTKPFLSSSPQSTLTGMSSWDLLSPGGSPSEGMSSGVSSPPTPVSASQISQNEKDAFDLLCAELLRLKVEDEIKTRKQQLIQLKQQQNFHLLVWKMRQKQAAPLNFDTFEASKFNQNNTPFSTSSSTPKVQGNGSVLQKSKVRNVDSYQARATKLASSTWAVHQNQGGRQRSLFAEEKCIQAPLAAAYTQNASRQKALNGSGMRAVFLGAKESGGTGVFLPRRLGSGNDTKRKLGCSTVLLPSRIVQALNLNVEDTLALNSTPAGLFLRRDFASARARQSPTAGDMVVGRDDWAAAGHPSAALSPLLEVAPDIFLPSEWTY